MNGILTGTGLEEPVVWYNDDENLGIRLLTIPIEDIGYAFTMIFGNVFLIEKFKAINLFKTTKSSSLYHKILPHNTKVAEISLVLFDGSSKFQIGK